MPRRIIATAGMDGAIAAGMATTMMAVGAVIIAADGTTAMVGRAAGTDDAVTADGG